MNNIIKVSAVALSALLLVGCGGDGDSGSSSASDTGAVVETIITGQFIDAPVEGLEYECSSGSTGTTDLTGTFTCKEDDNVTFKIESLVLGSGIVQSVITPLHLYPNDSEKAYNVAQLLHSLDDDMNPDNNIKLLTGLSLEGISINTDSNTFQNALASSLASMGKIAYDRDKASAKMLSYIQTNGNGNNYGTSVNITEELELLETLMCGASETLLNGECIEITCGVNQVLEDRECIVQPLSLNKNYVANDGLSVMMNSIIKEQKTGSYVYTISYTLTNNTPDKEIDEGSFKAFYKNSDGGTPQYGGFGSLFPGDQKSRSYSFETLIDEPYGTVVYGDLFFSDNPTDEDLVWTLN